MSLVYLPFRETTVQQSGRIRELRGIKTRGFGNVIRCESEDCFSHGAVRRC